MLDRSQGTLCPDKASIFLSRVAPHQRYCGSTPLNPRRGTARTSPTWIRRFSHSIAAVVLDLGEHPWAGIAVWPGEQVWVEVHVRTAYMELYGSLRPMLSKCGGVSFDAVLAVAREMARAAEWSTGRNSWLANATIAERVGRSVRVVQRARLLLRAMGVATEVFRGRQRTRAERLASWRVGEPDRGWTSVYALHSRRPVDKTRVQVGSQMQMAPHPRRGLFYSSVSRREVVLTDKDRKKRAAPRPTSNEECRRKAFALGGVLLASKWLRDRRSPAWARTHTAKGWGRVLAEAAARGWTPSDLNDTLDGWSRNYDTVIDPRRPMAFMRWLLAKQDLDFPPHVLELAKQAQEVEQAAKRAEARELFLVQAEQARQAGRAAGLEARAEIRRALRRTTRRS